MICRHLEQVLRDTTQKRHVAGDPRLNVERANLGRVEKHHAWNLVRHDGPARRGLDKRIDVDDLRAATIGLGERGEHPRGVRCGVNTHDDEAVRFLPVHEVGSALAGSERGS